MVRAALVDKNGLKKGAWSREEDDKLRAYIQRYGHWNWRQLPKFAGLSRCGKSCRLRWMNYLRPDVKHGNFSKEEEDLIIQLHEELGNKWCKIAEKLPGRTDNEIKNHWHTHLKKLKKEQNQTIASEMMKEQSSTETSQSVLSQSKNLEAETPSHSVVVESLPLSQETPSSELSSFSSESSEYGSVTGMNYVAEDSLSSMEIFEESGEDFWTQPFVVDSAYNQDGYPFSLTEEESFSWYASNYDDVIDWVHQMTQELPEN